MLRGRSTTLTSIGPDDGYQLFLWINEPDLVRNNAPYAPVHFPSHQAWMESIRKRQDLYIFAIRVEGQLIGTCQLFNVHPVHRSAEFQIRIGESNLRGKGHGTDAIKTCLLFAKNDVGLHSVWLQVFSDNSVAIRCYEKAGMRKCGSLRECAFIDGSWKDMDIMQIVFD